MKQQDKQLAKTFITSFKAESEFDTPVPKSTGTIELRVRPELKVEVICSPRYARRDELDLILEARRYTKNRVPVNDRATATAILLQRDRVEGD